MNSRIMFPVTNKPIEVVFIYLGQKLPKYAIASLSLAAKFSGVSVRLVGNSCLKKYLKGINVNFTSIEDFYNPRDFELASTNLSLSHSFRDGFWLKALERFFVLEQYWKFSGTSDIFHAELDQLLFRVDVLVDNLRDQQNFGLLLPFHNHRSAVASVLFCNNPEALRSLLSYSTQEVQFPNEMALIVDWAQLHPEFVFMLPTLSACLPRNTGAYLPEIERLSLETTGGAVDAAQLGQWLAGIDPRNLPLRSKPVNHFVDAPEDDLLTRRELKKASFRLDRASGHLYCQIFNKTVTIFNLHIHSKIHHWLLTSDPELSKFLQIANTELPFEFPGTRTNQVTYIFASKVRQKLKRVNEVGRKIFQTILNGENAFSLIFGRLGFYISRKFRKLFSIPEINLKLNRRPSSYPFISGDTFRSVSNFAWEGDSPSIPLNKIEPGSIIFCESEKINGFVHQILDQLDFQIIIIFGNSDKNHDENLDCLVNHSAVGAVFAQNLLKPVTGVTPLPIGLENLWRWNHGRVSKFLQLRRLPALNRTFRIMWTFTVSTNTIIRNRAHDFLQNNPTADYLGLLTPKNHRAALRKYSFIASPPGNGLDTHRTWEAMYLGSVPILLRSFMADYYEAIGLPVWVVDEYSELHQYSEQDLQKKYYSLLPKFNSEALWFDYWKQKILFSSKNCSN